VSRLACQDEEPKASIEGVLYDLKAGVMSIPEALQEIMGYIK
jgi:hypothetical protein